jgi:hypothetical protein
VRPAQVSHEAQQHRQQEQPKDNEAYVLACPCVDAVK